MKFEGILIYRLLSITLVAGALLLSGCATVENNHDPIEGANRVSDSFNESVDQVVLKPAATGYVAVTAAEVRNLVSNFYDNITYPNTILNDFLQGKVSQGFGDFSRLVINSTIGLVGLIDIATPLGFEKHDEDFGQTLAVWGASQGAYIVYPFLGPNSVRKTPDFVTATATDGLFWASLVLAPEISIPLAVLKYVDKRARLLDASDMRDDLALDPYLFTREAWRQRREYLIHDGNPPARSPINGVNDWEDDGDGWEDDKWESDDGKEEDSLSKPVSDDAGVSRKNVLSSTAAFPATDGQKLIINIASFESEMDATSAQEKLAKAYIQTGIRKVSVDARTWYRLYSSAHVKKSDAQLKLAELKALSGFSGVWLEPVH